jgi:hypothetical protein
LTDSAASEKIVLHDDRLAIAGGFLIARHPETVVITL